MEINHLPRKISNTECTVCRKQFREKSKLARHMLAHTGEKPHICNICKKGFSVDYNLKTHMRVHTGEKPFQCVFEGCIKAFAQSGNLATHALKRHSLNMPQKKMLIESGINESQFVKFTQIMTKALSKI